jgi:hypothetical protein
MTIRTLVLCLAVASTAPVLLVTDAHAAKAEQKEVVDIEMTGIEAFDSVFRQVKGIHDTLGSVQGRLDTATNQIASAVGQPEGTSLAMSMWELRQQAQGPIEVQMKGTTPVLTVGGNGGPEVQNAVQAVNTAAMEVAKLPADLAQLPQQVMALVNACKAFPGQLNPQLLQEAGMKPLELPKVAKTLGRNVKATVATPGRIESLVASAQGVLTGIPQGLKATEPPTEENLAAAKADKKAKKTKGKDAPEPEAQVAMGAVGSRVGDAMLAFHDAEVHQAMQILGQLDAELPKVTEPVPQRELQQLYQSQALVHLVGGNAAGASAAVAQALVVDPDAEPIDALGPEYARLHKLLRKADMLRTIEVPVQGSGTARISGQPIDASDGTVELIAGRHLLQVERNGTWTSQFVWVQDGFALTL